MQSAAGARRAPQAPQFLGGFKRRREKERERLRERHLGCVVAEGSHSHRRNWPGHTGLLRKPARQALRRVSESSSPDASTGCSPAPHPQSSQDWAPWSHPGAPQVSHIPSIPLPPASCPAPGLSTLPSHCTSDPSTSPCPLQLQGPPHHPFLKVSLFPCWYPKPSPYLAATFSFLK